MTDGRNRAFGQEGADVDLGLRPKNIGARVKRVEDPRLLTGQGTFTDDRIVPGALHVAFRRSDHAHALISSIGTAAAAEVPGVFAIYTAQDLHDLVEPVRASSRMKNYHATALYPLARDKVRYVGEPVVAVFGREPIPRGGCARSDRDRLRTARNRDRSRDGCRGGRAAAARGGGNECAGDASVCARRCRGGNGGGGARSVSKFRHSARAVAARRWANGAPRSSLRPDDGHRRRRPR